MNRSYYYPHRVLCDVLEEMRSCYKTRNFASISGLIEEAQAMGNRMEAALGDHNDLQKMHREWSEMKDRLKSLNYLIELKEKEAGVKDDAELPDAAELEKELAGGTGD